MTVAAKTKTLLRDLMPPLAARALRKLVHPPAPGFSLEFSGDYSTWAAAAAECGQGYQADEPVQREARRTRDLLASDGSLLTGMEIRGLAGILSCGAVRTVLDFGGGVGQHFFRFGPHLAVTSWVVCETEAMAKEGRASFARPGLEFIWSLDEVATRRFDVAFTAGAIQAVPDPLAVLTRLAGLAQHIVINRLPLAAWPQNRLTVSRIGEVGRAKWACPIWFFSEASWFGQLEALGLKATLRWTAPDEIVTVDGQRVEFQGMVLSRRQP